MAFTTTPCTTTPPKLFSKGVDGPGPGSGIFGKWDIRKTDEQGEETQHSPAEPHALVAVSLSWVQPDSCSPYTHCGLSLLTNMA